MVANFNHDSCWDPKNSCLMIENGGAFEVPLVYCFFPTENFTNFEDLEIDLILRHPFLLKELLELSNISWFWDAQIDKLNCWDIDNRHPTVPRFYPNGEADQISALFGVWFWTLDREWLLKFTIFIKLAWTKHLRISWDDLSLSSQIFGCKFWFSFVCCICVFFVSPLPPCHCLRWFCWSNVSSWKPWNRVPGTLHCLLVWDFQFLSGKLKGPKDFSTNH